MGCCRKWLLVGLLLVAQGLSGAVDGASMTEAKLDVASDANAAYTAKDWAKAVELYTAITSDQPKNGRAWYRLGASLHGTGANEKAIVAFQKAIDAGAPPFFAEYGMALAYASMKNSEKAFEYLEKSVKNGFSQLDQIRTDEELASLRSDLRFTKVVHQVEVNGKPCAYAPENRQFDFWIGEWNVVTSDGIQPAGTSKIALILGDCVIEENWTSGGNAGYAGKSYNVYNSSLKRWEQFWADNAGGMIHFYGEMKGNVMDYWTDEMPQPDGTKLKRHLQFMPLGPDKVRQFSQGSTDGGKTWAVEYDFTYNRKK